MTSNVYAPWIEKAEGLAGVYLNITHPLQEAVRHLEFNGVYVDVDRLHVLAAECEKRIEQREQEFFDLAGDRIYYQSPSALGKFLYEDLQLVCPMMTKAGRPSTALPVLDKLIGAHPSIAPLMSLKKHAKLKKDFLDGNGKAKGLLPFIGEDGRIHSNYRVDGTESGRLSATQPNLMNIPKSPDEGSDDLDIRSMFTAQPGHLLIAADYSQLELRVISYVTGDGVMQRNFNTGMDFHRVTAAMMFKKDPKDVTKKERSLAKAINFGIAYGMGGYTLAYRLGIPPEEAEEYIATWFRMYREVKRWLRSNPMQVAKTGYAETMFGRRRHLPELKHASYNDPNWKKRQAHLQRIANNFPIQSTGSDILSLATIALVLYPFDEFVATGAKPIMSLHDALYFEVPEENAAAAAFIVKDTMENLPREIISPDWNLPADAEIGRYWGDHSTSDVAA